MSEKMWGGEAFWGLGYEWDPEWVLTDRQRELRDLLLELCQTEMRDRAKVSDDNLEYPRANLELLGKHGFLGLTVPEEYGGLGQDHVAFAMTVETIARYGCASTAMCYVMHIGAVNTIMLRATPELIDKYIRPLNSGKIGTLSYSDPETGSHFWYPISSGAERSNGGYKVRKKASWTTSGGFADFYVIQTTSPEFTGYDDLSVFVIDGEDVKAHPASWDALGLRGNQSGPIEIEDVSMAVVSLASGAMVNVVNSMLSPRQETELRFDFQRATVEVRCLYSYEDRDWTFTPLAGEDASGVADLWKPASAAADRHALQLSSFLDALDGRAEVLVSVPDIRPTYDLMTSLYKSAATGRVVERKSITGEDPFYRHFAGRL